MKWIVDNFHRIMLLFPSPSLIISSLLLLLLFSGPAWAVAPGTSSADFLNFAAGPRAVGMGESQTAVADDPYAAYWNPAGLSALRTPQLAMTYNQSFESVDHQYLSLAYPLDAGSTLDLNLTRLGMTSLAGYDAQGNNASSVGASDYALGLAYGRVVSRDASGRPLLSLGLNLKGIQETLDTVTARTFAADLGILAFYRPKVDFLPAMPGEEWSVGLAAKNLGPGLKFDSQSAPLPASYHLGLAFKAHPRRDSLTVSLDQVLGRDQNYYAAFGAEYVAWRMVALRLGYRMGQDIGSGFRVGAGFIYKGMGIDYAFAPYGDLGQMHRFGLSVPLNGWARTEKRESGESSR